MKSDSLEIEKLPLPFFPLSQNYTTQAFDDTTAQQCNNNTPVLHEQIAQQM